jgi:uncharacterized phage protein gp47/JayE
MPDWGVTSDGFENKPLTTAKAELDARFLAILGASAGTESDGSIPAQTLAGQIVAAFADFLGGIWELAQEVYTIVDPAQAEGDALDAVCSITGTERRPESESTVTATCCGTPATVLPVGRVALVEDTGTRFASTEEQTIAALDAWVDTTAYLVDDRVTNADRCYICITAGTSAGSGGPTTDSDDETDGTVHWKYLGEGTGAVDVEFEAEDAGELAALAGALNEIATPVSGWQTVTNLEDADLGAEVENDTSLRLRREAELAAPGNATADAIRAAVLRVNADTNDPVTACRVFTNETLITDGDGLPGKSVEVLVLGGEDDTDPAGDVSDPEASVAAAVWSSVAAGIETYGTTTVSITDAAGNARTVKFTRPTDVDIFVRVDVTYDASEFPDDGEDQIKEAIAAFDESFVIGYDVTAWKMGSTLDDIPGIINVTLIYIGVLDPPAAATTITITSRQRARFEIANVTVNLTPGTP